MINQMQTNIVIIILAPLIGSIIAGLLGKTIGRRGAHWITTLGIAISFVASLYLCYQYAYANAPIYNENIYTWGISGRFQFHIGFLLDKLSTIMLVVVNFISLAVHVYSIGYMRGDSGYQRFFSYISLFTFCMLTLVAANNFLLLFFGWEGVGLVSYLLIGFWFKRESANFGSLKAFIVNRIGDLGFLLGIALIFSNTSSVDYSAIFAAAPAVAQKTITLIPGMHWSMMTVICVLLFIGAMGKSAQMPLHVWLPESMEGPTPISALIHAATMVTAGVYMISRLSLLFSYSPAALGMILVVGATTALFMGILAIVQTDIKRVIAYSTLSQLGYMVAALGVTAYSAAMFQLITHAFFKALLFLAAGSVIIALHHEQDMRKMGNLRKYMPVTYVCFLVGALALAAIPPFSGFYSKDSIITAVSLSTTPGAVYAYWCVLLGTLVTSFYIFRAFFLVFHTEDRMDAETRAHVQESPRVIWLPLVVLAIPSIGIGAALASSILSQSAQGLLNDNLMATSPLLAVVAQPYEQESFLTFIGHSFLTLPVWFAISGVVLAWLFYVKAPQLPHMFAQRFALLYKLLLSKYGFDDFNQIVFVRGGRYLAGIFFHVGDEQILDHQFVNGSGRVIAWLSRMMRKLQSGYLYHYAFAMIIGLLGFLAWLLLF